jgi:hypothetical protein
MAGSRAADIDIGGAGAARTAGPPHYFCVLVRWDPTAALESSFTVFVIDDKAQ